MCSRDLPEEDVQVAVSNLKTVFSSDNKVLRELALEVKHLKRLSKTFHVSHTCQSTIKEVQQRLVEIDKGLLDVCLISEELCQLQNICHNGDEDTPDPEKLYPDSYSTLIELLAQHEANCRLKEDLENLINQVHMKLLKAQAELNTNQSKSRLHHSHSLDSQDSENTKPNTSANHRRQSTDGTVPFTVSLFPELSQETLKIAQQEYHKLRPLQPSLLQGDTQKQASSVGPIRIPRSPIKTQGNVSVYSPVQQCTSYSSRVSLTGSLNRVRSPVLTSFLRKEQEKNCLEDITNLNNDKS